MEPYKPLLLNDRDEKGVSRENYMNLIKMNPSRLVSKTVDAPLRQTTIKQSEDQQKNSYNLPLIHRIVIENQVLQAKLKEEQNKAQLATNKYLYLQMMYKKMEYERLIEKEKNKKNIQPLTTNFGLSKFDTFRDKNEKAPEQMLLNETMTDRHIETQGQVRMRIKSVAAQEIEEETPKVYKRKFFKNKKVLSPEEVSAEVQKMKDRQMAKEEKQKLHQKLWACVQRVYLVIRIVIKWSENIRKKRKIVEKYQQEQSKKAKGLFREIKKCDDNTKKSVTSEWVQKIVIKIFQAMKGEEMRVKFSSNFNPNNLENVELQKKWLIYYSIFFMKTLEENTRDTKIPEIQCLIMTLQLYKYQDKKASLFVAVRTPYLSAQTFNLSDREINLITSEYLLFSVLIPMIIEIEQGQNYFNEQHKYQCRLLMYKIFSLLQLLFISLFYDMEQKKVIKLKIEQKKIEIIEKPFSMKFITEPKTDDEQVIIQGLEKKQKFEALFIQHKEVLQDLKSFLEIIVSNIGKNAFI